VAGSPLTQRPDQVAASGSASAEAATPTGSRNSGEAGAGLLRRAAPLRKISPDNLPHMALNIKDESTDRLVRELAAETGETITTAVTVAVRERLERLRGSVPRERRAEELTRIAQRSAQRPVLDGRSPEEILGYGPDGLAA
jgi:antitoxin VapB